VVREGSFGAAIGGTGYRIVAGERRERLAYGGYSVSSWFEQQPSRFWWKNGQWE
jgi:hypothetical protein